MSKRRSQKKKKSTATRERQNKIENKTGKQSLNIKKKEVAPER